MPAQDQVSAPLLINSWPHYTRREPRLDIQQDSRFAIKTADVLPACCWQNKTSTPLYSSGLRYISGLQYTSWVRSCPLSNLSKAVTYFSLVS